MNLQKTASVMLILALTGCTSQSEFLNPEEIGLPYERTSVSDQDDAAIIDTFGIDCQVEIGKLENEIKAKSQFAGGQKLNSVEGAFWYVIEYQFQFESAEDAVDLATRLAAAAINCERANTLTLSDLTSIGNGKAWESTLTLSLSEVVIEIYNVKAAVAQGNKLTFVVASAEQAVGLNTNELIDIVSKALGSGT